MCAVECRVKYTAALVYVDYTNDLPGALLSEFTFALEKQTWSWNKTVIYNHKIKVL